MGFTPKVEEGMARLGTWMPFRAAQRELAFFLGVEVAEASVRQITEQAGAAQVQVQAAEVETLLTERPESPAGPEVQLMSLDGALIQLVTGEWKEVKTLALGIVSEAKHKKKKKPEGEVQVQTRALSYFSRMSEAQTFQQESLGEVHRRGVEKAGTVCAVSDGADWIQKGVDYHRKDAVRILDAGSCDGVCEPRGSSRPGAPPAAARGPDAQWAGSRQTPAEALRAVAPGARARVEDGRARAGAGGTGTTAQPDAADRTARGGGNVGQEPARVSRERQEMIRYASFRAQGYPIGSGSVERANKLVVQSRMKQAGMRWEPSHVNAMLAMRNLACNDRWTEGWAAIRGMWRKQEVAARAQRVVCPCASGESASPAPPTVLAPAQPPSSSEPSPPPLTPTKTSPDQTAPAPSEPRPVRPAPTHPWRRPFIRRRSA